MKIKIQWLDATLVLLGVVSLAAVLLTHERDFMRKSFCAAVPVCPNIANAEGWNKIAYDLGSGGLTSLIFYMLLVRHPEADRRRRAKQSLARRYAAFKRDLTSTVVGTADGAYDVDLIDELVDHKKFREYFRQDVGDNQDRWHRFLNNLEDHQLRELQTTIEIFRGDLELVMTTVDMPDEKTSDFFKRLTAAIHAQRDAGTGYDEVKPLSRFLWELLAGWSFVEGERETDIVEDMIAATGRA